jgi:hypothetical protein
LAFTPTARNTPKNIGGGGYRVFPNDGGQFQMWSSGERIIV